MVCLSSFSDLCARPAKRFGEAWVSRDLGGQSDFIWVAGNARFGQKTDERRHFANQAFLADFFFKIGIHIGA